MAEIDVCGKLKDDIDLSCIAPVRGWEQQVVIINFNDIDRELSEMNIPTTEAPECVYNVAMELIEGGEGVRITGSQAGTNFKGYVNKTKDDNGYPTYVHNVDIFLAGLSEEVKCALDALDRGRYVVAMQLLNGEVHLFGYEHGVSTGDYDYDLAENSGGSVITLQSNEENPENYHPLTYKPEASGSANTDFNDKFKNAVA